MATWVVTLEIKGIEEDQHPGDWDWAVLLDLPDRDDVRLLGFERFDEDA